MPLRAIAYVSEARLDLSPPALDALVEDAARYNRLAGVTGVLLQAGNRFLQYAEGPGDGLESVYERILQAGSHAGMVELARGSVSQRLFPYWPMRRIEVAPDLLRRLSVGDWAGFSRRAGQGSDRPTAIDLINDVVQPLLSPG